MAATLPYPSIVFVPLDILTAEELNQMAQNTSFLAGLFPVSSDNISAKGVKNANIDDSAVKSSNIDWSTIKPTTNNYLDLGSVRIQWGTFSTNSSGAASVTLPSSFANTGYSLVLSVTFPEPGDAFWWVFAKQKTQTGFTAVSGFKHANTANGIAATAPVSYIAIGNKP